MFSLPLKSVNAPPDPTKKSLPILYYYLDKAKREFRTLEQQLLYELTFNCNSQDAEIRARTAGQVR